MRDRSSWARPVVDLLCQDPLLLEHLKAAGYTGSALVNEARQSARRIARVELGLTLLLEVDPGAPASAVRWLLTGYRYGIGGLQDDQVWHRVQRARQYLVRLKGRVWREALREYLEYPSGVRLFHMEGVDGIPELPPGARESTRYRHYHQTLDQSPPHKRRTLRFAETGRYYVRVFEKEEAARAVPVEIPPEIMSLLTCELCPTRPHRTGAAPTIEVRWEALLATAKWMDEQLQLAAEREGLPFRPRYAEPFGGIRPLWLREGAYGRGEVLTLEGLLHVVGLLNVGKSTFLEVLACYLTQQGHRVAVILQDVPAIVEKASLFRDVLGVAAAPVLGARDRRSQLESVYRTKMVKSGSDIYQGGTHPAQRWFSFVCPLLGLAAGAEGGLWGYGEEPCTSLYETPEGALNQQVPAEEGEILAAKACQCPFLPVCPRRQLERDVAAAQVWFLTRASWVQTHTPIEGFDQDLLFSEAVYRTCDVVLIDEADRVQVELDEAFAPDEALVDTSADSFLNRTSQETAAQYLSARAEMKRARYTSWSAAEGVTQTATNRLYHLLLNKQELVDWLGESPFTGRSVWAQLVRELVQPRLMEAPLPKGRQARQSSRAERIRQSGSDGAHGNIRSLMETVRPFTRWPLQERELNTEWSQRLTRLAFQALFYPDPSQVREAVAEWLDDWLQEHHQLIASQLGQAEREQLIDRVHFAVLLCVLDDQLGYIVDNLPLVRPLLDLDGVGVNLVNRPSLEYLAVLPEAPVGNILGFQYHHRPGDEERGRRTAGGILTYFRYAGVGRALMMDYPTLFAWDGLSGPHTLLISGTSFAPGSPTYHVATPPGLLLSPADTERANQMRKDTHCRFLPQRRLLAGGVVPISVSGRSGRDRRESLAAMTRLLAGGSGGEPPLSAILRELRDAGRQEELWQDRDRILLVTGSYAEAALVKQTLVQYAGLLGLHPDQIALLGRDRGLGGEIRRGEVDQFAARGFKVLVAPLLALERGHNILNAEGRAAFGAVLFLVRPMPVPDSWQPVIQQLNAWTLTGDALGPGSNNVDISPLEAAGQWFYRGALAKLYTFSDRPHGYRLMTDEERKVLCMTQLVTLWQLTGRLVRGNVPAHIYFVDAAFAPVSAGFQTGDRDNRRSSLLVGMTEVINAPTKSSSLPAWERTLYESLYGIIADSLAETEGLILE